jgi:threonine/homoserine/homoserine lactone efflux protein
MIRSKVMTDYNIIGYILFAAGTAITPGPNNFILFSFGKQYGVKRTLPIMAGIFTGFGILLYLAGYGVSALIIYNTSIYMILKIISSLWLLYLAYSVRIITISDDQNGTIKIGYVHALFMQFINPKAWIMAINGAAAFLPTWGTVHVNVFIFTFIYLFIGTGCMFFWTVLGDGMSRFLNSNRKRKITGNVLAILMVVVVISIWIP